MNSNDKMKKAFRRLAEIKFKKYQPQINSKVDEILNATDINRDDLEKTATALKLVDDLSKGTLQGDINKNLSGKVKITPSEKLLKLKYKKRF